MSCKIGDSRLKGMETGPGLMRALAAVLENGCDVINMSYGEATMTPDIGRVVAVAQARGAVYCSCMLLHQSVEETRQDSERQEALSAASSSC